MFYYSQENALKLGRKINNENFDLFSKNLFNNLIKITYTGGYQMEFFDLELILTHTWFRSIFSTADHSEQEQGAQIHEKYTQSKATPN
jgi:hypothetical protein